MRSPLNLLALQNKKVRIYRLGISPFFFVFYEQFHSADISFHFIAVAILLSRPLLTAETQIQSRNDRRLSILLINCKTASVTQYMRQMVLYGRLPVGSVTRLAENRHLMSQKQVFEQITTKHFTLFVQIFTGTTLKINMSHGRISTSPYQIKEIWGTSKRRYSTVKQFRLSLDLRMHGHTWFIAKFWTTLRECSASR